MLQGAKAFEAKGDKTIVNELKQVHVREAIMPKTKEHGT